MNKKIDCSLIYKDFWSLKVLNKLNEKIVDWRKGKIHSQPHHEMRPLGPDESKWWTRGGVDGILFHYNDDVELIDNIKNELNNIYDVDTLEDWKCGLRIFSVGGSLPWHVDDDSNFVTTTYLNQGKWDRDWGGALLNQDKHGEVSAIFPEYNKMIIQSNGKYNMPHAVIPIQQLADENVLRISLQTFAAR